MPPERRAPKLLLVHGAWHGAWCWEKYFAPWLRERGHQVETIDLPGHGTPGPQRIPWLSVSDYVDAVEGIVKRSDRPVIVAGHSMGGFVVQKLMERRPEQLAGAALVAAAPPQGVLGVVLHLLRTRPLDFLSTSLRFDMYHLVREPQFAQAMFYSPGLPTETLLEYWKPLQNESFRAFLDMIALNLPNPDRVDPALPKWIIGGERDIIFPPDVVRQTGAAYDTPVTIYPDMAHNLMLDPGWEQVAADFSAWIGTALQRRVG